MQSSYTKRRTENGWLFDVQPASPVSSTGIVLTFAIPLTLLALFMSFVIYSDGRSTFKPLAITVFFAFVVFSLLRMHFNKIPNKQRAASSFEAGPEGILSNKNFLVASDIHHFMMKNWASNVEGSISPTLVVGTPGFDTAFRSMNANLSAGLASARQGWMRKVANVSWQVDAEAGGKATMLACGLDEITARGLVEDLSRALHP
ncbi:hypothetical protein [Caballeronia sp. M23-90]